MDSSFFSVSVFEFCYECEIDFVVIMFFLLLLSSSWSSSSSSLALLLPLLPCRSHKLSNAMEFYAVIRDFNA